MDDLQFWDFAVIAAYFLIVTFIGYKTARGKTTPEELFLAGRSLGPLAIGFSLFASNISSDTLIGLPGAAYQHGISAANYEWMAGVVLMFTAIFVLPVLMRARITTMPELMERRFDSRLRKYLSVITLFLSIILDTAGTLYAGGLIVTTFIPGTNLWEVCALLALFTSIYTAFGGLRAVVYTDVMQACVLIGGSAAMTWIIFGHFDYSWSTVKEAVSPEKLSLIRPLDDPSVPWLGLITGVPIVGFYYWSMNQYVVQRLLGARDIQAAGRASIFAAALKLLPIFIMTIPGAMVIPLLPGLEHPDQVYPKMVQEFTPTGLTGLILAGLIAALMSTLSSTLNSSATLLTLDFIKPARPDLSDAQLARWGRICTFILAAIAALWGPMIQYFSGLWAYLQQVFAFVASPLVATFLMGLWVKSLGSSAALSGLASGHILSAILFVLVETGVLPIHFTIIGGILFAATALFTWLWKVRLGAGDRPDGEDARIAVIAKEGLERVPRDVMIGIVIVSVLTAIIVYLLR
ncbi:MAG: sodium/solute symporter [Salinicola sp.]|uniref:sodium:solute symporter family transporter n=1 Tax=Salinicola sp. TaxID=1978524 RepID=UPI001D699D76|nr:sodium/solute symporter [Salinicola sp.]NRB58171.1 sodium/solute symporter [Salinicola sp.]